MLCSCATRKALKLPTTRITPSPQFLHGGFYSRTGANFFNEQEDFERMLAAKRRGVSWIRLTPSKWQGAMCKDKPGCFLIGSHERYQGLVQEDLDHLLSVLDWAQELELKVVLTFLTVPGRVFAQHNQGNVDARIWQSFEKQDEAIQFFTDVALYVGHHPALLALNPINEPAPEIVAPAFEDWYHGDYEAWYRSIKDTPRDLNHFYARVVKAVRNARSHLPIMLDAGLYGHPWAFKVLEPVDDPNIYYAFHWYMPFVYGQADTKFTYPGSAPAEEKRPEATSLTWDRTRLASMLEPVVTWASERGIDKNRIVVGEYGVNRLMQGAAEYLADSRALFVEHGFLHAFYSFREPHFARMDYELGRQSMVNPYRQALVQNVNPHYGKFESDDFMSALGLAPLSFKEPIKGFNTWNWFGQNINQNLVIEIMDAMESAGLREAGYDTIFVDDGWRAEKLSSQGLLEADAEKFPDGIKSLADKVHARGFKLGLHIPIGTKDCARKTEGTFGRELINAARIVDWDVDVVKLDQCVLDSSEEWPQETLASTLSNWHRLLSLANVEIMASAQRFYRWLPRFANYGRTTLDIRPQIFGGARFSQPFLSEFLSVAEVARQNSSWYYTASENYLNDADILVVDNGLTKVENESHLAMWAMMNAPLLLGNDPRAMSAETRELLKNEILLAINEDTFESARLIIDTKEMLVFRKRLKDGLTAVLVVNLKDKGELKPSFSFKELDVSKPSVITQVFSKKPFKVQDKLTLTLASHACELLILK